MKWTQWKLNHDWVPGKLVGPWGWYATFAAHRTELSRLLRVTPTQPNLHAEITAECLANRRLD